MSEQRTDHEGRPMTYWGGMSKEGKASPASPCYRLLNVDDEIKGSDEFLEDDGKTWTRIDESHQWTIGNWWNTQYVPMRRILCDNSQDR